VRLDAFLSKSLGLSRREARKLVREGKVKVEGRPVKDPSFKVGKDAKVEVEGEPVSYREKVYLLLYKPPGYLSTTEEGKAYPSFLELLGEKYGGRKLFSAGRLDAPSRGLLLVTDDGELAHRLTHPRHKVEKEYLVKLDKPFKEEVTALRAVKVEGRPVALKEAELLEDKLLRLVLTEGRHRIVRRLLKALGYQVEDLLRVRIGPLKLEGLKEGEYRELSEGEVKALKESVGL